MRGMPGFGGQYSVTYEMPYQEKHAKSGDCMYQELHCRGLYEIIMKGYRGTFTMSERLLESLQ